MEKNFFVWWFINETTSVIQEDVQKLKNKILNNPNEIQENIRKNFDDILINASMSGIPIEKETATPEILFLKLQKHFAGS